MPCFDANFHGYDLNLFKLMGDNNIGDIFSAKRAALLYNMSWFFLKDVHPDHMSTKCCSLSCTDAIHHFMVINGFHTMPRDPTTFSKGARLIASLILILTLEGSIPPPLCSQGSLSLNH